MTVHYYMENFSTAQLQALDREGRGLIGAQHALRQRGPLGAADGFTWCDIDGALLMRTGPDRWTAMSSKVVPRGGA